MATQTGTSDHDILNGTAEADTINGGAGNDTINAGSGDDVVKGGLGKDIIDLGAGDDILVFSKDDVVDNSEFYGSWRYSQIKDVVDGGTGTDKIGFDDNSTNYDITRATISNVETLDLRFYYENNEDNYALNVALTIDQLKSFVNIKVSPNRWTENR